MPFATDSGREKAPSANGAGEAHLDTRFKERVSPFLSPLTQLHINSAPFQSRVNCDLSSQPIGGARPSFWVKVSLPSTNLTS